MSTLLQMQIDDLSLGYLTLPRCSPVEIIDAAAAASLRRAGLRIAGRLPTDEGRWPAHDPVLRREVAAHANGKGVLIGSVAAYYTGPQTSVESFRPAFETAAMLGAKYVCTSGYDPDERRLSDTLSALAEEARAHQVSIALEFVPYSELQTLAAAVRVLAAAGASNLKILFDAMHFFRSGGTVEQLTAAPMNLIAFAQICDGPLERPPGLGPADEARTGRLLPGEGEFPLRGMLGALGPYIDLEIETPTMRLAGLAPAERAIAAVAATRAFLRQLASQTCDTRGN